MMYPDGAPSVPGGGGPSLLPTPPDLPHPVAPGPPIPNVSNTGSNNDPKSGLGLYIPPVPPDQQRMMQSPKVQKHSQAIPIVSPEK